MARNRGRNFGHLCKNPRFFHATTDLADPASRSFGKAEGLRLLSFTDLLGGYRVASRSVLMRRKNKRPIDSCQTSLSAQDRQRIEQAETHRLACQGDANCMDNVACLDAARLDKRV
jgi:hypothetical protein